jgi:thiol:disulfide interchange protein DsbA
MNKKFKKLSLALAVSSTLLISGCFNKEEVILNEEVLKEVSVESISKETMSTEKESLDFKEGLHYRIVKNIDNKGMKEPFIVEYFWLACGHCQSMEPLIKSYLSQNKEVDLLRKHGAFNEMWIKDAKIFNRFMMLGLEDNFDDLFKVYMDATQKRRVVTNDDITLFLESKSIDAESFWMGLESDAAMTSLEEVLNEMTYNKIAGVPALVVNGKYLITPSVENGITTQNKYFEVLNFLKNKK